MEQKTDWRAEQILRELSNKMEALYDEQTCRMRVSDTVRRLLEKMA